MTENPASDKTNSDMEPRLKRLIYRANYRGFKEADIILGGFAKAHAENLTDDEITQFEHLMEARDHDIYAWIAGRAALPPEYDTPLFARILAFAKP